MVRKLFLAWDSRDKPIGLQTRRMIVHGNPNGLWEPTAKLFKDSLATYGYAKPKLGRIEGEYVGTIYVVHPESLGGSKIAITKYPIYIGPRFTKPEGLYLRMSHGQSIGAVDTLQSAKRAALCLAQNEVE